jgi:LPXTG-site transpeptidase (sortase) family protein
MTMTEAAPTTPTAPSTPTTPSVLVNPPPPPSVATPPPMSDWAAITMRSLLVLAGLAAWLLVYAVGFSALHEHHEQRVLYSHLRENLANATAPLNGHIADGTPLALINAPAGGIHDQVVVEGTTSADLESGPGHYPGTALPGEAGISTIMGRHTTYGAPFSNITSLRAGDLITVTTDQGIARYSVQDVRGPGSPLPATLASGAGRLTLITSASSGWRGGWTPTHAVYVDASLTSKPFETASGSGTFTSADNPMASDRGALVPLVLWLQALVLATLAIVWARARWGRRQTWVIGGCVLIALLWGATGAFLQLLPNLL